jgi:hypothetical protein
MDKKKTKLHRGFPKSNSYNTMAKRQRTNNDLQNTTQKPKIEQHDTNATNSRE